MGTFLNVRDAERESSLPCFEGHHRDVVRTRERRLRRHDIERQLFGYTRSFQMEGVSAGIESPSDCG